MTEKEWTLDEGLAVALRHVREAFGARQEAIAAAAREIGLSWTAATVAAVETHKRNLSKEELLLLPLVLRAAFPDAKTRFTVDELLVQAGVDLMWLGPGVRGASSALLRIQQDQGIQGWELETPKVRAGLARATADSDRVRPLRRWWPRALVAELLDAERDAGGEAERKASRRLGVEPVVVSVLSHRSWGESLSAHRDALAAQEAEPNASAERLRALRGHITRRLLDELATLLTKIE